MIFVGDGELRGRLSPYKSAVANHCTNDAHRSFRTGVIADEFRIVVTVMSHCNQCVCVAKHDPYLRYFIIVFPYSMVDDIVCIICACCFSEAVLCNHFVKFLLCLFACHLVFLLPFL